MYYIKYFLIGFSIIELLDVLNIYLLYFKKLQGKEHPFVGVFNPSFDLIKTKNELNLVKYLSYWVANCKLLLSCLVLGIAFYGSKKLQVITCLIISLGSLLFYYKLYPLMKEMGVRGMINPVDYYKILNGMMIAIIVVFFIIFLINRKNI